jgi:hypothetical protein
MAVEGTGIPAPARDEALARWSSTLLTGGVSAGPLFLVVSALQAATREGFDVTRHPASFLSIGDWGWIQVTNFIVTGLLLIACAAGIRVALRGGRGGTWGPLLIGAMGIGLIAGGAFVADPAFGFPPGTPDAMPDELTTHGALHGAAQALGGLSLVSASFVFARRFAAQKERGWSRLSVAVGILALLSFAASGAAPGEAAGTLALGVALAAGFLWISGVAVKLRRENDEARASHRP